MCRGPGIGRVDYPLHVPMHGLFQQQASRSPLAVAVECGASLLSYSELDAASNRLAHLLMSRGVEAGSKVGLYVEHSAETLVSILGIMKAGAGYVPIDVSHPARRVEFIVRDAAPCAVVTMQKHAQQLPTDIATTILCLDALAEEIDAQPASAVDVDVKASDLAYVIYTSGSTGVPKGVKITHRNLVNYICWAAREYAGDGEAAFALYSSIAFDLTVTSIFTPLVTGNRVVVYNEDDKLRQLQAIVDEGRVDVLKLTPSHLSLIKRRNNIRSRVRRLIVGGEALESVLAREVDNSFGGKVEIINEYGPTEATVGCMIYRYDREKETSARVAIGRPAANTAIYLLDDAMQAVAENVAYMKFINAARQTPVVETLLPLATVAPPPGRHQPAPVAAAQPVQYEFLPGPRDILEELLPVSFKVRLFKCFLDAAVSEQIARRVTMKQATENADDMIKTLTRQYNRARQAGITKEILEVISGAEALK